AVPRSGVVRPAPGGLIAEGVGLIVHERRVEQHRRLRGYPAANRRVFTKVTADPAIRAHGMIRLSIDGLPHALIIEHRAPTAAQFVAPRGAPGTYRKAAARNVVARVEKAV